MAKPAAAGGAAAPEKKGKKKTFKKKERKHVPHGIVHVQASFNNTIVTITDPNGNVLSWKSSGSLGFRGSRKGTPFAAQQAASNAANMARDHGVRTWMCASAARVRAASPPSARWPPPESKSAPFRTSRRFRTTAAVRRSAAECRVRVVSCPVSSRSVEAQNCEATELATDDQRLIFVRDEG